MSDHIDIAGNEITAGAYIIYAGSLGRCAILKYGRVVALTEKTANRWNGRDHAPVAEYKVQVVTVDHYSYSVPRGEWKIQKKGQRITLGFLDRMIVVASGQVPKGARDVLTEAYNAQKDK